MPRGVSRRGVRAEAFPQAASAGAQFVGCSTRISGIGTAQSSGRARQKHTRFLDGTREVGGLSPAPRRIADAT